MEAILKIKPSHQAQKRAACISRLRTCTAVMVLMLVPAISQAIEEPEFKVLQKMDDVEIREYAAYSVAEVTVAGPAAEAGNQAFPILAGYIFGKNKGERKFAMTAPVTQAQASQGSEPVKLEMTAPVTQAAATGGFKVQFVLPKGVNMSNAPEPLDSRVTLRDIAPGRIAVIRYSGFWSDANYNKHLTQLQASLRIAGLQAVGEPIYSRYNAPITPWFMRRNEIWLNLVNTP